MLHMTAKLRFNGSFYDTLSACDISSSRLEFHFISIAFFEESQCSREQNSLVESAFNSLAAFLP